MNILYMLKFCIKGKNLEIFPELFLSTYMLLHCRTFTTNMRAFGLSKELCLEFLRKQSTIADLKDGKDQFYLYSVRSSHKMNDNICPCLKKLFSFFYCKITKIGEK